MACITSLCGPDRDLQPVRPFECFTADLHRLADWLQRCGVNTVAMQSTGVYWIPLYEILDERGIQVYLVNARHTKNLPGRKSDVQESQWLLKLHTYGLLNNSFQPPSEIRVLRTYWRQRGEHVRGAATCVQRMQKALTQMNVQLANVISDVSGLTGQTIFGNGVQAKGHPLKGRKFTLSNLVLSRKDKTQVPLGKDWGFNKAADDKQENEVYWVLNDALEPYERVLPLELGQALEEGSLSGVQQGALQLGIDDTDLLSSINNQAAAWARERAAELVGMAYDTDGSLIVNPNAEWAITDTTRQALRDIIADSFLGNVNREDILTNIKAALETSPIFSDYRAQMIARTELGRAQMGSSLEVWRRSGQVKKLVWEAVGDNPCPVCLENDGEEVDFGDPFPNGATSTISSHIDCECLVRAVSFENTEKVSKEWIKRWLQPHRQLPDY